MDRTELIRTGVFLLVIVGAVLVGQVSAQPIEAPYTITTPGMYELSEDVRGLTDINGIIIECDNVVLDGVNHFLGGEGRENSVGIYVNKYGGSITNITIKNFILEDWETAIGYNYVKGDEGDSNLITRCDIVKSTTAIHIQYSDYITITENQISDCSTGIIVEGGSTNTVLEKNKVSKSGQGINILNSPTSVIKSNNINTCSQYGLEVIESDDTIIEKNAISDNKYSAIKLENAENCIITGNNLAKTEIGAVLNLGNGVRDTVVTDNIFASYENVVVDAVSSNIVWNSTQTPGTNILGGPYLGGNFWSDDKDGEGFSDTAPDEDGYGIADTPYRINEYNIDYLPLKKTTATKAPEEQITIPLPDVTLEQVEAESEIDTATIDLPNVSVQENKTVITGESGGENLSNDTFVISHVIDQAESFSTLMSVIGNVTDVTALDSENNATNVTALENETKYDSKISNVSPVFGQNISISQNTSPTSLPLIQSENNTTAILNRSITNAYHRDESSPELVNGSSSDLNDNATAPPAEPINENQTVDTNWNVSYLAPETGDSNQTIPALVGYLVFNSSVPGIDIVLLTKNGNEVALDPMDGNSLTVPVPVEGLVYQMYRANKPGYHQTSDNVTPYPGPGETTTILVNMSKNDPAGSLVKSDAEQAVPPLENTTPESGKNSTDTMTENKLYTENQATDLEDETWGGNNTSSASTPVVNNDFTPVVVTNGVVSKPTHTIRASAGPGGIILPEGNIDVEEGRSVLFTIQPDDGHQVAFVVVDGIQTSPMTEYGFMNVTADHTIITGFV